MLYWCLLSLLCLLCRFLLCYWGVIYNLWEWFLVVCIYFLFISIWWLTSNLCALLNCFLSLSCVNVCSSVSVSVPTFLFGCCPFRCDSVNSYF